MAQRRLAAMVFFALPIIPIHGFEQPSALQGVPVETFTQLTQKDVEDRQVTANSINDGKLANAKTALSIAKSAPGEHFTSKLKTFFY